MYALIRQILIAFILIAITFESQCEIERYRLNHVLERVALSSEYHSQAEKDFIRSFDMECAKNFLNLPQNNKILIDENFEVAIFVISTLLKCSDAEKTYDEMIAKNYILSHFKDQLSCLKWQLRKYEPTSKLVENYVSSETDAKECGEEFILEKGIKKFQNALEKMLGSLKIYTCGAIGEDIKDILLFIIKGTLIKFDDISDELRKSEKQMLMEQLKDIAFKTVDCVIKRFEHDPQAYLVNDTINFYYNKEITSTDSNEEDPSEIDKKLIKLESTIDKNCVKEKLNLPENGEKSLINVEASIIIASAKSKCIKVDPIEFSNLFLDYAIADFYRHDPQYSCARHKLHKLEPTSKLAKITGLGEYNHDYCRQRGITIEPYSLSFDYNFTVGKLSTSTCGVFTDDILSTIELKTFLLTDEKDKDLKISETRDLFEFVTYKLQKLADCILERI